MVNHKTVASRVGLIGSLISLLILGMVSVTFKNTAVFKEEPPNSVRSVCTYMSIPYLDDVVVNICMDSKQPISMASVNTSVNVNHGRISEDDIITT